MLSSPQIPCYSEKKQIFPFCVFVDAHWSCPIKVWLLSWWINFFGFQVIVLRCQFLRLGFFIWIKKSQKRYCIVTWVSPTGFLCLKKKKNRVQEVVSCFSSWAFLPSSCLYKSLLYCLFCYSYCCTSFVHNFEFSNSVS